MLHIFLAFLALAVLARTAHAEHTKCSWSGPGKNPESGGYLSYCDGYIWDGVSTYEQAHYVCDINEDKSAQVATYGVLRSGCLSFATPCGDGGFTYICESAHWGFCLDERDKDTGEYPAGCYYMASGDDCELRDLIDEGDKPESVSVWREPTPEEAKKAGRAPGVK
ncbi:hypothetical protein BDZ90DRAFT_263289 [Jaminaea rosea]|uniref:Uncharacterized protein n=1 Tax=Jaminaea rosea TaxID=1569628 RepID=A0A316UGS0_9BASI|nr:hypothetical protein BDZ90DRAFT_263289 [Jaminaea rosea]PWN24446.1 hypothetical protein BDZ90DRAFT_263289 [Jaminaea rosea]